LRRKLLTRAEAKALEEAHAFFQTVRCHLHLLAARADDRLTFDVQPEIALRMGYADAAPNERAEKFMKDYFLMTNASGHLTRTLCTALEAHALKSGRTDKAEAEGFPVRQSRLTVKSAAQFKKKPSEILRLFRAGQVSGLDIHPDALRFIQGTLPGLKEKLRRDPLAHAIFLDILLAPKNAEQTLRHMNEAGILGALIPAFEKIVAHMQYDMYHVFTSDEHTLRAVGMLHKMENGEAPEAPLASALIAKMKSRRALFAAMFLHDIAKGAGGKHSEKGAAAAKIICPRLGLDTEETETACWLVENHLLMTSTAYKRDLSDPKTAADFAAIVQTPERLRLLTVMTSADVMAVGPDRWNNWKSGLISELYHKAHALLSGAEPDSVAPIIAVQKKARRLVGDKLPTLNHLIDAAPRMFWLGFTPEAVAGVARALHGKLNATVIRITPEAGQDFTEVLVHTPDRKGLFATLSGAMAAAGASIAEARIFTLSNGMALDIFQVQTAGGQVYENTGFLQKTLKAALDGDIDLAAEIAARQKTRPKKERHFAVAPRVLVDNDASASSTVIEIDARDRTGLLFDITSALTALGLQISSAKIATFGSRAVDVFYVKDAFGLKVVHPGKVRNIEKSLLAALKV
jgi:[protein-PII] uridylyltransferase